VTAGVKQLAASFHFNDAIRNAPGNRLSVLALLVRTFRFSEIFIEQGWHLTDTSENTLKRGIIESVATPASAYLPKSVDFSSPRRN
jgi:hypothetical protein